MIKFLKCVRRRFLKSLRIFSNRIKCHKLGIKYNEGVSIGKKIQIWGKTKVILGKNSRIASNVILWGNGIIKIGENTSIGENSWIFSSPNGGVHIGNDVNVAANLYMIDSNHCFKKGELIRKQPIDSAPIFIGNDVWIGANVTIIKGARVGDGCVIGACSLVNSSITEEKIVAGVPARVIGERK